MSRKFTGREKALLFILALLLVCAGYYILVHQPVVQTIESAGIRQEDAESQLLIEQARARRLRQMEEELAALRDDGGAALAEIPDYDNAQEVVRVLNAALAGSDGYNLVFSPVSFSGSIASRAIDMSFTCQGYGEAKGIIQQLYRAPYRCQITGLALTSSGESGDVTQGTLSVKLTIVFYEYAQQAPAELPTDE